MKRTEKAWEEAGGFVKRPEKAWEKTGGFVKRPEKAWEKRRTHEVEEEKE